MKLRLIAAALVCLGGLGATAARADSVLYSNGTANSYNTGNSMISHGSVAEDSFQVQQTSYITGIEFAIWSPPAGWDGLSNGVQLANLDWWISDAADSSYNALSDGSQTFLGQGSAVSPTLVNQFSNGFIYEISTSAMQLEAGHTYYLTLGNAVSDPSFFPGLWDLSYGSSQSALGGPWGFDSLNGGDGSHTFEILGQDGTAGGPLSGGTATVPEPGSMMLLGSGLLALAARMRRKSHAHEA